MWSTHTTASTLTLAALLVACGGSSVIEPPDEGNGGSGTGSGTGTAGTGGGTTTTTSAGGSGAAGFDACTGPGQCVVVSETCCGVCGMPTLGDVVAIHESRVAAYFESVCADPEPCPDCPTADNPDLFAYCDAGHCRAADMRAYGANTCSLDEQCRLRWGLGCCECNALGVGLTAIPVSFEAELQALVCEPNTPCPECMPQYPPDADAYCADGHCAVVYWDSSSGS